MQQSCGSFPSLLSILPLTSLSTIRLPVYRVVGPDRSHRSPITHFIIFLSDTSAARFAQLFPARRDDALVACGPDLQIISERGESARITGLLLQHHLCCKR